MIHGIVAAFIVACLLLWLFVIVFRYPCWILGHSYQFRCTDLKSRCWRCGCAPHITWIQSIKVLIWGIVGKHPKLKMMFGDPEKRRTE